MAKATFAGAAGGIVRWIALKEPWKDGLGSLIVGAIMAPLAGPFFLPLFSLGGTLQKVGMSNEEVFMFSGFCTGVSGIFLTGFLIDLIKGRTRQYIKDKEDEKRD